MQLPDILLNLYLTKHVVLWRLKPMVRITGIGEGRFNDVVKQCAEMIVQVWILRIEHIW